MLRHSFIHARGVGQRTERWLWEQGIRHWDDLDRIGHVPGLGPTLRKRLLDSVESGRQALTDGDTGYFQRRLPSREGWRIFGEFRDSVRYLDIETDGLFWNDAITVIGVSDGRTARAFVAGRDLERFATAMEGGRLLVTFNGKGFDVPFIRRVFPEVRLPAAHIDLMHSLRALGLRGGLKSVERQVGLHRGDLDGLDGAHAVTLWRRHRAGDSGALELLVRYNLEDVMNLKYLMEWAYNRFLSSCGGPGALLALERPSAPVLDPGALQTLSTLKDLRSPGRHEP
ncbi:MAG: ribonuclease H-like domain-containing protein [Candidatus Polarisedimenticolia bacterium]